MKPGDFLVGVTGFFSILLPGAVLSFIAVFWLGQVELPPGHPLAALHAMTSTTGWTAFAVVSYLMGYVVASLGAGLDPLYDDRKDNHRNEALKKLAGAVHASVLAEVTPATANPSQTQPLASETRNSPGQPGPGIPTIVTRFVIRILVWRIWPAKQPTQPRKPTQPPEVPINMYHLARSILSYRAPTIFAEVEHLEANSKFFRSLVVVSGFLLIACVIQLCGALGVAALCRASSTFPMWYIIDFVVVLVVLRMFFAQFCKLRLKATETAFQGMLVVTRPSGSSIHV